MKVYYYDENGIYTGPGLAPPSPLEPGRFLIPAKAALVEPPEAGPGQSPVWNGVAWELKPDFRGQTGYNIQTGQEVKIKNIGPWPADLSPEPKPGAAYAWDSENAQWRYSLELDSPGSEYRFMDGSWIKIRFTKKEFLLVCGLDQVVKLNAAINSGNTLAKTVHDLLMSSEYIDVTDPTTGTMLELLTTIEGGQIMSPDQVEEILKGRSYERS